MKTILFIGLFMSLNFLAHSQSFSANLPEPHYFLLLPTSITNMYELGENIAEYNQQYHTKEALQVSTVYMQLDKKTVFYYIDSFPNEAQAMAYYKGLEKRRPNAIDRENALYYFFISKSNLNKVLKAKSIEAYKAFFMTLIIEG